MTIAIVSDAVLPFNKGGKETRIYHLAQGLSHLGYDVHIYTMRWWGDGDTYTYAGLTYHALSKYYPLYSGSRRSIKEGLLFGLACLGMIRYKFDILEVDHMPFFPLYAAKVVSIIKRRPLYATWHEVWGRKYWQSYLGSMKGLIAYSIERISVLLPDHIIVVSPRTQTELREALHYHGPLSLVPNGIDFQAIEKIRPLDRPNDIIFVGRLLPHKHVDQLIEAVALLKTKRPGIRCTVIGGGPEQRRLEEQIKTLHVQQQVTMTGFVESADTVFAHMKASKLFVLPSTREGFGITVLEAFACNLPVVTVNNPDNAAQDLVKEDLGIICDATPEALAAAIEQLLAKRPKHATLSTAHAYGWDNIANTLAKVYAA